MKKISAAFDGLKYAPATAEYAQTFAAAGHTLLSGVFLSDFLYHNFTAFDMVGEEGISKARLKGLLDADKKIRVQAQSQFEKACIAKGLQYSIHEDQDFALEDLLKESVYSDMLIIGMDETLSHHQEMRPTSFIRGVLAGTQCPVLLVPKNYKPITKVVLLYDGSPSSVYAIRAFHTMLPWLGKVATEVLYVSEHKSKTLPEDILIREFIQSHYPDATYSILNGNAYQVICERLKTESLGTLVVLGAYRRSTVSRLFKPSLADRLMTELSLPLFVAHNR